VLSPYPRKALTLQIEVPQYVPERGRVKRNSAEIIGSDNFPRFPEGNRRRIHAELSQAPRLA